jgi:hypothetical protein
MLKEKNPHRWGSFFRKSLFGCQITDHHIFQLHSYGNVEENISVTIKSHFLNSSRKKIGPDYHLCFSAVLEPEEEE